MLGSCPGEIIPGVVGRDPRRDHLRTYRNATEHTTSVTIATMNNPTFTTPLTWQEPNARDAVPDSRQKCGFSAYERQLTLVSDREASTRRSQAKPTSPIAIDASATLKMNQGMTSMKSVT